MKYKVTLNNRVYEVEVEQGEAMLVDEYELAAPAAAAPAAPIAAPAAPAAAAPAAPAPAAPAAKLAPGVAGEVKLYDTDPRTAAMLMAIVADELKTDRKSVV